MRQLRAKYSWGFAWTSNSSGSSAAQRGGPVQDDGRRYSVLVRDRVDQKPLRVARDDAEDGPAYRLTPAGAELAAVVRELGTWGQRWLSRDLHGNELDVRALVWDIHRRVRREALPEKPLVVRIEFTDLRGSSARHYLLLRRSEVSLCTTNPGYPEELVLRTDRRTLIGWWRGDLSFRQARQAGLALEGRREWVRAFPDWFERYLFAAVAPAARAGTSLEAARGG